MVDTPNSLPHWDLDIFFPGPASPKFLTEFQAMVDGLEALERLYELGGCRRRCGGQSASAG